MVWPANLTFSCWHFPFSFEDCDILPKPREYGCVYMYCGIICKKNIYSFSTFRARTRTKKHQSSTPTGTENEKSLSESDSSDSNNLGASIIGAIFNKHDMKSMLQGIVTDALQSTQKDKMPRVGKFLFMLLCLL